MANVEQSAAEAAKAASPSPVAPPESEAVPPPPLETIPPPPPEPISAPLETVPPPPPQEHPQPSNPQYVESTAPKFIGEDGQNITAGRKDIESGISEAPNGVQPEPGRTNSKRRSGLQTLQNISLDGILDKLIGAEKEEPTRPSEVKSAVASEELTPPSAVYTGAGSPGKSIAESEDSSEHPSEGSSVCAVILYFAAGLLGSLIMTTLTVLYGFFRVFRDVSRYGAPLAKNVSFVLGSIVGFVAAIMIYHAVLVENYTFDRPWLMALALTAAQSITLPLTIFLFLCGCACASVDGGNGSGVGNLSGGDGGGDGGD